MKDYKTILLDIENIITILKFKNESERQEYNSKIKSGIRSLESHQIIGLLPYKKGQDYIPENKLAKVSSCGHISKKIDTLYLATVIKKYGLKKEETLIITGDYDVIASAKVLNIDQCYVKFLALVPFDIDATIKMNNIENLNLINRKNDKGAFYINSQLLSYLREHNVTLRESYVTNINTLKKSKAPSSTLIVTDSPSDIAKLENTNQYDICFINNHGNDCIDFTPTYEMSIESAPTELQKLLTNYQIV